MCLEGIVLATPSVKNPLKVGLRVGLSSAVMEGDLILLYVFCLFNGFLLLFPVCFYYILLFTGLFL